MHTNYLAEVATEAATGETARIFEEIRRLSGTPLVALIYRHLATMPGALEAVWRSVAPLMVTGELQERAWEIARNAWTGPVPPASDGVRGMRPVSLAFAIDVIDAYNRSNPINYMIVSVIRAAHAEPGATRVAAADAANSRAAPARPWAPPTRIASIAIIPSIEALSARCRAQVDGFSKSAGPGEPVLVPTLYRHLGHWPALLSMTAREVRPRLTNGDFEHAIRAFREASGRAATELAQRHAIAAIPQLATPRMTGVFDRFSQVIPEMVVVGSFLRRILDKVQVHGPADAGKIVPVKSHR